MLAGAALVALTLAAGPTRLSVAPLTPVDISNDQAAFFTERLLAQLAKDPNVRVLRGADQPDADGAVTGSVSHGDDGYVLDLKITAPDGGTLFAHHSRPLATDRAVLTELDRVAFRALNSIGDRSPEELLREPAPPTVSRSIYKLAPTALGVVSLIASSVFFIQAQNDYGRLTGHDTLAMPELVRDQGKQSVVLGVWFVIAAVVLTVAGILWYALS